MLLLSCGPATAQSPRSERAGAAEHLPARQFSSPAEVLSVFGIGAEQLSALRDGQAVDEDEQQTIIRILFRMPQFPRHQLHEWSRRRLSWEELAAAPEDHRLRAVRVDGKVRSVISQNVPAQLRRGVGFEVFYRVEIESESLRPTFVYTRSIPDMWAQGKPLNTPTQATGLFLKLGPTEPQAAYVVVASRVAWFPKHADPAAGLRTDHVFLAKHGFDVGLFDQVRKRNRMPLGGEDRECFYSLLAVVERIADEELERRAPPRLELAPLLQQPAQQHGRIQIVAGTARRITRIVVDDRDIQRRLGIDHYFQIDMFVPLGDQIVRLGRADAEPAIPTFSNTFPVTVCVRSLPPGLVAGEVKQEVRIAAVHFKLWAYRSQFVSSYDASQLQIGPMLIGRHPVLISRDSSASASAAVGLAVVFMIALVGIWLWAWRFQRQDAVLWRARRQRRFAPPTAESLDGLKSQVRDYPNFDGLEESSQPEGRPPDELS